MPTFVASMIGFPAVGAAMMLVATEAYRLARPDAPLFGDSAPSSFADAIMHRAGMEQAFEFIREGANPDELLTVSDPGYTAGRTVYVSPLMLAVAAGDGDIVLMLLSAGARLDLPQNQLAGCFAEALGASRVAEIVAEANPSATAASCPEPRRDAPTPLLAWVDAK